MRIVTDALPEISISRFQRLSTVVDLDPPYQREGGIWSPETRAKLIDSIINGFDIPKLYFESVTQRRVGPNGYNYQYAVLDGKQRLEAILDFLNGRLRLPTDFWFYEDEAVSAAGLTLGELWERHAFLARRFVDFELPLVVITADSGDLIEEMFQRLNASSSLNAAERRNAVTGPTRDAANALAEHDLLVRCSPIKNARYKYRELAAKFLAIERQLAKDHRVVDTKADTLYRLFTATRQQKPSIGEDEMRKYKEKAHETLDRMNAVFSEDDRLLASIGTVVVYYIAFRDPAFSALVDRDQLAEFEQLRRNAAQMNEFDPAYARPANNRLREYNGWVQSTNDGRALTRRAQIMGTYVEGHGGDDPLSALDGLSDGDAPDQDTDVEGA